MSSLREDVAVKLAGAKEFSKLDASSGYCSWKAQG